MARRREHKDLVRTSVKLPKAQLRAAARAEINISKLLRETLARKLGRAK